MYSTCRNHTKTHLSAEQMIIYINNQFKIFCVSQSEFIWCKYSEHITFMQHYSSVLSLMVFTAGHIWFISCCLVNSELNNLLATSLSLVPTNQIGICANKPHRRQGKHTRVQRIHLNGLNSAYVNVPFTFLSFLKVNLS